MQYMQREESTHAVQSRDWHICRVDKTSVPICLILFETVKINTSNLKAPFLSFPFLLYTTMNYSQHLKGINNDTVINPFIVLVLLFCIMFILFLNPSAGFTFSWTFHPPTEVIEQYTLR